jgi:hypothetical protein
MLNETNSVEKTFTVTVTVPAEDAVVEFYVDRQLNKAIENGTGWDAVVNEIDYYAAATTCVCGTPVEQLDGGGYSYWVHVDRMRTDRDHAAVPKSALALQVAD